MKNYFNLGLTVFTAFCGMGAVACSGDTARSTDDAEPSPSTTDVLTSTGPTSTAPVATPPPMTATPSAPATPTGGNGGTAGMGGADDDSLGGAGGAATEETGPTCDIAVPSLFYRSDTDEVWDDNDFSDITFDGSCPLLVNVTWPHEEGWENADPAEANREQTHFTLETYRGPDLTGQQLNLTIELTDHQLGPSATAAGYIVSLLSVSTYDRFVVIGGDLPTSDAGLVSDAGLASSSSDAGDAGSLTEPEEPVTSILTGYAEAESSVEERALLRRVGDRATIVFPIPNKTAEADSYDPTRAIKINIRIYNAFSGDVVASTDVELDGGRDGLDAGGVISDMPDAGLSSVEDAGVSSLDAPPSASTSTPGHVYDYLTAQFAITNFSITEVTGL